MKRKVLIEKAKVFKYFYLDCYSAYMQQREISVQEGLGKWSPVHMPNSTQTNPTDCGVHVLMVNKTFVHLCYRFRKMTQNVYS